MTTQLYDQDFYAWTRRSAELIRQGRIVEVDFEHVAEELENMGGNTRRELISRLSILLAHLLKWQWQPVRRGNSWRLTIANQRDDIEDLLEQSPSLRHEIDEKIEKAYVRARRQAAIETGLDEKTFPAGCPFSIEQALDPNFWPDA